MSLTGSSTNLGTSICLQRCPLPTQVPVSVSIVVFYKPRPHYLSLAVSSTTQALVSVPNGIVCQPRHRYLSLAKSSTNLGSSICPAVSTYNLVPSICLQRCPLPPRPQYLYLAVSSTSLGPSICLQRWPLPTDPSTFLQRCPPSTQAPVSVSSGVLYQPRPQYLSLAVSSTSLGPSICLQRCLLPAKAPGAVSSGVLYQTRPHHLSLAVSSTTLGPLPAQWYHKYLLLVLECHLQSQGISQWFYNFHIIPWVSSNVTLISL